MNNNKEVQELIQELTKLHIEFNRHSEQIETKIKQIQKRQNKKTKGMRNENKQNFRIRDIAEICNRYKSYGKSALGIQGKVTKIIANHITIQKPRLESILYQSTSESTIDRGI
jgi:hypothetical protein